MISPATHPSPTAHDVQKTPTELELKLRTVEALERIAQAVERIAAQAEGAAAEAVADSLAPVDDGDPNKVE
jgi:hypothetical protein